MEYNEYSLMCRATIFVSHYDRQNQPYWSVLQPTRQCKTTDLELHDLLNELSTVDEWYTLGVYLGLHPWILAAIKEECATIEECRTQMLLQWQNHVTPTWSAVVKALVEIGQDRLASDLAAKYGVPLPDCELLEEFKAKQKMPTELKSIDPAISSVDSIQGVEVIAVIRITVFTRGTEFEWEGYGLKLHVPKGSLPSGMSECRVNIKASLSGQFKLPEDSDLLSPVFWISAPCKFTQPVTLEIQHCALRKDKAVLSDLSFVSAKCSQKDPLPYKFKELDGGVFSMHSSYGSIQLSCFSGFGITGRRRTPRLYCVHLYHTVKQTYDWRFYLAITQDLAAQVTALKGYYAHKHFDTSLKVEFQKREIILDIPEDGIVQEGWKITPISFPMIAKREVDGFRQGQQIPQCELMMEWKDEGRRPVRLQYKVVLKGASPPRNYLYLVLDPAEGAVSGSEACSSKPDIRDLAGALYHKVADKWKTLGILLNLPKGTLATIEISSRDPRNCLIEMLETWLERTNPPPTWDAIIESVEFLGEEQLGKELREKYHCST